MHPTLNVAIQAIRKAGDFLIKKYEKLEIKKHKKINKIHLISNIYKETKEIIINIIKKYYPTHNITNNIQHNYFYYNNKEKKEIYWIISPIDSIINFAKQFPHFSLSIAVIIKNKIEIAVIYDPIRNELFSASRGYGAQLNGYKLRGSIANKLDNIILSIYLPCNNKYKNTNNLLQTILTKLTHHNIEYRCTGSINLDLAYLASGRIDGIFATGINQKQITSGELIIKESGCLITDFKGEDKYQLSGNVIAGNNKILQEMILKYTDF